MRTIILTLTLMFLPLSVYAQNDTSFPEAGEAMESADAPDTQTAAVTKYDFEGDEVDGEFRRPLEENLFVPLHGKTKSMLKIRMNFLPEMLTSVEDI